MHGNSDRGGSCLRPVRGLTLPDRCHGEGDFRVVHIRRFLEWVAVVQAKDGEYQHPFESVDFTSHRKERDDVVYKVSQFIILAPDIITNAHLPINQKNTCGRKLLGWTAN